MEGGEGAEEPRRDWPVPWSWSGRVGRVGRAREGASSSRLMLMQEGQAGS